MSILAALDNHYRRLAARGEIPPYGYSTQAISFALILGDDGCLVDDPDDLRDHQNKKRPGAPLAVPQPPKRTIAPLSSFLWDNSKYVLGVGKEKNGKEIVEYPAHFAAFKALHETMLAGTDDPGLLAVLAFLRDWSPARFIEQRLPIELLDQNIVFRWDDDEVFNRFVHDRPAARLIWENRPPEPSETSGMCLVTGRHAPFARLHPSIGGVWGAQSSGASLVSFNLDAFESYGKIQGANAPVSKSAAFNYGAALNALLASDGVNRTRAPIGDASTVFWASVDGVGEEAAANAEHLVGDALNPPPPLKDESSVTEKGQTAKLRDALNAVARGLAVEDIGPALDPKTRFHVLGLSPNAARLSVRFWFDTTLGSLALNLTRHYDDLKLDPPAWRGETPAPGALLYPTALQEKRENIHPLLAGELMRAILTGRVYPRLLLSEVLQRIRAGDPINGPRAAICKAWLTRNARLSAKNPTDIPEDHLVSLNTEEKDPAYRLGRLFAVLEHIQYRALGSVNAGIRDRYFGTASASPAGVFPLLLRGSNHHLSVLRKRPDTKRLAAWFEGEIGDIMNELPMNLPRHFGLEDQGRFVVGYHHQRFAAKSDKSTAQTPPQTTAANDGDQKSKD